MRTETALGLGTIWPIVTGLLGNGEKRPPQIPDAIVQRCRREYVDIGEPVACGVP